MKIQKKTFLILVITFLTFIILFFMSMNILLYNSYLQIENNYIRSSLHRIGNIIQSNLSNLTKIGKDWSEWDDSYKFIEKRYPQYLKANLLDKTFFDLHMNLIVFYNLEGNVIFGKYFNLKKNIELSLSKRLMSFKFFNFVDSSLHKIKEINGILYEPDYGFMLITALPILPTNGLGPSNGILIMGYTLDSEEIAKLSQVLEYPISISLYDKKSKYLIRDSSRIEILDNNSIKGTILMNDIFGEPILQVTSVFPRTLFQQGQKSLLFFAIHFTLVSSLFIFITMLSINKFVLKRIKIFSQSIKRSKDGSNSIDSEVNSGNDEITELSTEYSNLLERISMEMEKQKSIENQLLISNGQLRELTNKMDSIREEERSKIALELHDELGQLLTRLKLDISYLESITSGSLPEKEKAIYKDQTSSINNLITNLMSAVRKITSELRPSILDSSDLSAAIEWQILQYRKTTNINFNLLIEPENIDLEKSISTTVFRILQEALINIIRHSQATTVDIFLEKGENYIFLEIRDNGIGISVSDYEKSHSLGIIGMREKVKFHNGSFEIFSNHKKGTIINVRIPINQPKEVTS